MTFINKRVKEWNLATCLKGTIVYHNTNGKAALNIIENGIKPVQNAWGGGILGAGFYTHATRAGAEVYGQERYTIEFQVTKNLIGQIVPRGVIGRGIDNYDYNSGESYLAENDFLTNEDDLNEYKFHNASGLKAVKIYDNEKLDEASIHRSLALIQPQGDYGLKAFWGEKRES